MSEFAEHLHLRLRWSSTFSMNTACTNDSAVIQASSSNPDDSAPRAFRSIASMHTVPRHVCRFSATTAFCDAFHLEIHGLQCQKEYFFQRGGPKQKQVICKQSPKPPKKSPRHFCYTQTTSNNLHRIISMNQPCFCNRRPSIQSIRHPCPNV